MHINPKFYTKCPTGCNFYPFIISFILLYYLHFYFLFSPFHIHLALMNTNTHKVSDGCIFLPIYFHMINWWLIIIIHGHWNDLYKIIPNVLTNIMFKFHIKHILIWLDLIFKQTKWLLEIMKNTSKKPLTHAIETKTIM